MQGGNVECNEKGYTAKQSYRNCEKASRYDQLRYNSLHGRLKNWTKKRAIGKALSFIGPINTILDLPCGTGRFCSFLSRRGYDVIGADISYEMMLISKEKSRPYQNYLGYLQCDAEDVPFKDHSVDCILSIRFMFHLPPHVRKKAISEMRRITRKWMIVDFRHSTFKTFMRRIGVFLGFGREKTRSGLEAIRHELTDLGFRVHKIIKVVPVFSEKVVFICEKVEASKI